MEGVALGKHRFYLPGSMSSFHKLPEVRVLGDIALWRTSVSHGNVGGRMNHISCDRTWGWGGGHRVCCSWGAPLVTNFCWALLGAAIYCPSFWISHMRKHPWLQNQLLVSTPNVGNLKFSGQRTKDDAQVGKQKLERRTQKPGKPPPSGHCLNNPWQWLCFLH